MHDFALLLYHNNKKMQYKSHTIIHNVVYSILYFAQIGTVGLV